MDYSLRERTTPSQAQGHGGSVGMPRDTRPAGEEVDLGLWKLRRAWCENWKKNKRREKRSTMRRGLCTKGASRDLHEKVVIVGVFHLILLVLVLDLN